MHKLFLCLWGLAMGSSVQAESIIAATMIRAQTIIEPQHLAFSTDNIPGALTDIDLAIGQQARAVIYAGAPIHASDLRPATIISRNQKITVVYQQGGLTIITDGRALGNGALGEWISVMNVGSKAIFDAQVVTEGTVYVRKQ